TIQKMKPEVDLLLLWRLKILCRWSLGIVWIWEGLVPKILWPTALQSRIVEGSGLYWPTVEIWLVLIGLPMITMGVILCVGWLEKTAVLVATLGMTLLIVLVLGSHIESLADPHGGIPKDACLYAAAWVVWKLAPVVPKRPS
ncbi:MAG: DoxX-like family protein, partial [Verrucomicrobiota bacterium]